MPTKSTKSSKTTKATKTTSVKKNRVRPNFAEGRLYVKSTFNNTLVSGTDPHGNVLTWSSSGRSGFKGSRKSTPYAATTAIERTLEALKTYGIKKLSVFIKGPGVGRDAVLRFLRAKRDFEVEMVADITPIPHNGPRPPKIRRV